MALLILMAAHLIADFSLQSSALAEKKTQKFRYLVGHSLIYAIAIALVAFLCIPGKIAAIPIVILVSSHFFIDWIRICANKRQKTKAGHFLSFVLDQVLHIAIIFIAVNGFNLNGQLRSWLVDWSTTAPVEQAIRYGLIFIIILDPTSIFVKELSNYVSGSVGSAQKQEPPVGSIIGKLERIIIAILVLCNELSTIGFVLAAKSLARYKQLEDKDFAEKYLVGTLSSTAIAITATLLLK